MSIQSPLEEQIIGAFWGAVIGDALGVPVEFQTRSTLERNPVVGMRGYGTHHQAPGTWSDDSSLMLCTVASLNECNGLDLNDLAKRFVAWLYASYMTPWGDVFAIGNATASAIGRLQRGVTPTLTGGADEQSNGNGSLMRILPIALYFRQAPMRDLLQAAHDVSALTHRHPRSQMACGMYCLLVTELLWNPSPMDAYHRAIELASAHYKKDATFSSELKHYERFLSEEIPQLPQDEISSGGYVVDTLEASVWCLMTTNAFVGAVLRAVNLGGDTDTTGTVTGGLAGLVYGVENIPKDWQSKIARAEELQKLMTEFAEKIFVKESDGELH